jgi:hypothetical protein
MAADQRTDPVHRIFSGVDHWFCSPGRPAAIAVHPGDAGETSVSNEHCD